MKKEILTLIIGILIGAIIATGVFLALKGDSTVERGMRDDFESMGEPPEIDGNEITDGTRPTRPDEGNTTQNDENTTNSNESNI